MTDTESTTPAEPSPGSGAPWDGDPLTPDQAAQTEDAEAKRRAAWSTPEGAETPSEAESEGEDKPEAPETA
jgi:hypothetical protein